MSPSPERNVIRDHFGKLPAPWPRPVIEVEIDPRIMGLSGALLISLLADMVDGPVWMETRELSPERMRYRFWNHDPGAGFDTVRVTSVTTTTLDQLSA